MIGRPWRSPVLVAAVLAVGLLLAPGPPPAAGSDGPCPDTTGVTVVVDYQALGGGVVVRCAPGSPATGFKALTAAGFDIEEVRNVPGFLCRIDGRPGPEPEACINTPPASAYWSYWHAARGGTWTSSQEGGRTRTPAVGSVEGWSFSDDGSPGAASPPGIDPPAATATPKPVTPTPRDAPTSIASATATPTAESSSSETIPTADPTATATTGPSEAPPPTADPTTVTGGGAPSGGGTPTGGGDTASGGSPSLGTLVGVGLVVLIAGGALLARARRSTDADGDA